MIKVDQGTRSHSSSEIAQKKHDQLYKSGSENALSPWKRESTVEESPVWIYAHSADPNFDTGRTTEYQRLASVLGIITTPDIDFQFLDNVNTTIINNNNRIVSEGAEGFVSTLKRTIQEFYSDYADQIPKLHSVNVDDGSILFEWISKDFRIGFNIEPDPDESSWNLNTGGSLTDVDISAFGDLNGVDQPALLRFLISFMLYFLPK